MISTRILARTIVATCCALSGVGLARAQSELPVPRPPSRTNALPPGTMKLPPMPSKPTVRRLGDAEDVRLARTGRWRVRRELEMLEVDAVETKDTASIREAGARVEGWLDALAQDPWPWRRDTLLNVEWATLQQVGRGWAASCKNEQAESARLVVGFEIFRRAVEEHCAKAGSPWPLMEEVALTAVRLSEGVRVGRPHYLMVRDLERVREMASVLDAQSAPTWSPVASDVAAWGLRARRICEVADYLAYDAPYPTASALSRTSSQLTHLCFDAMERVCMAYPRVGDPMPSSTPR